MKPTLVALLLLSAASCGSSDGLSTDHACSIALDKGAWSEVQTGVVERSELGPLSAAEVDGVEQPVVGKMCWAHSDAQPTLTGEYLVEDVGQWVQDFPWHSDPQTYVKQSNARLGKLAK